MAEKGAADWLHLCPQQEDSPLLPEETVKCRHLES